MTLISSFQMINGALWVLPVIAFFPSVLRVWRTKADVIDVLVSPLVFIGLTNVGFIIPWMLFPSAVVQMGQDEIVVWSGLYTLSSLCAVVSLLAWRKARGAFSWKKR